MELDGYLRQVTEFAQTCLDERTAPQDLIESRGLSDPTIAACLSVRATVIDPNEENRLSAYLPIGFFRDANDRAQRLASFAFCFDIQYEMDVLTVLKQCEPYRPEQRLFASAPTLFSHIRRTDESNRPDLELIARNAIKNINGSEIYAVDGGYARLTHLLNPGIVNWARATFPAAPMFVRLDPHVFEARQPPQYLAEATLVPANPTWLWDFSLRKGMGDSAKYFLPEPSSARDSHFWDYKVKGIRRLEISVERRERDYLTMMIEELPRPDSENGLMIARCVHLDTRDPAGVPINKVKLQHLDLAINVYKGEDRQRRFAQSLTDGKVEDATFRTHLFRIERAEFLSVFYFCGMFLRSPLLLSEWIQQVMPD